MSLRGWNSFLIRLDPRHKGRGSSIPRETFWEEEEQSVTKIPPVLRHLGMEEVDVEEIHVTYFFDFFFFFLLLFFYGLLFIFHSCFFFFSFSLCLVIVFCLFFWVFQVIWFCEKFMKMKIKIWNHNKLVVYKKQKSW